MDTIGEAGMSVQTEPLRDHADRVRWLDEVMATLDLTDVHLVGFSSGDFYAVHQAIHAPGRLASITLPVTAVFGGRSGAHNGARGAERLRALLPHSTVELWPDWRHSVTDADRARLIETILAHT